MSISIVTYLYKGSTQYNAGHANILYSMLKRNLTVPFTFHVIGNISEGLNYEIDFIEIAPDVLALGRCFPRIQLWSKFADFLEKRILLIDLDCVITGNLDFIFDRKEPYVLLKDAYTYWGATNACYNGSLLLIDNGCNPSVWDDFITKNGKQIVANNNFIGSDQAWYALKLGRKAPVFTNEDGLLSYKLDQIAHKGLPENAKVVFFHGSPKPWDCFKTNWVKENYK